MGDAPLAELCLTGRATMPHFRQEGKGGLWGVGNGMREASAPPAEGPAVSVPPRPARTSGDSGVCGKGTGPRSRRSGREDGRSADAAAAPPFPAEPRAGPGDARRPPTSADGTAWLYRRRRRAYTRPPSQEASAGVLVCERDFSMEGYQAKVPAHIPQKGLIKPGSCLSAVRWEKMGLQALLAVFTVARWPKSIGYCWRTLIHVISVY